MIGRIGRMTLHVALREYQWKSSYESQRVETVDEEWNPKSVVQSKLLKKNDTIGLNAGILVK